MLVSMRRNLKTVPLPNLIKNLCRSWQIGCSISKLGSSENLLKFNELNESLWSLTIFALKLSLKYTSDGTTKSHDLSTSRKLFIKFDFVWTNVLGHTYLNSSCTKNRNVSGKKRHAEEKLQRKQILKLSRQIDLETVNKLVSTQAKIVVEINVSVNA